MPVVRCSPEKGRKFMRVALNGTVIATFENDEDARAFHEWKCNKLLWDRNDEILDEMARKEGIDRRHGKSMPAELSKKYYKEARRKIEEECVLLD